MTGGLFISADGSRRVIPNQFLLQAELSNDATMLRLSYTFCSIEVSGRSLEQIFDDALSGRLGAISALPCDAHSVAPWVTSIIFKSPEAARIPSPEQESSDA